MACVAPSGPIAELMLGVALACALAPHTSLGAAPAAALGYGYARVATARPIRSGRWTLCVPAGGNREGCGTRPEYLQNQVVKRPNRGARRPIPVARAHGHTRRRPAAVGGTRVVRAAGRQRRSH
eukprot:scaffold166451_cov39-Tisochrysis_lutea.AAC.2